MSNIIEITDLAAPELAPYARLSERELLNLDRPEEGLFIAESPKVIGRALDAGYVPTSLLMERSRLEHEERELLERCGEIPVYVSELSVLKNLTGFPLTRGTLCAMRRRTEPTPEAVCAGARRIAVLERVMNPTNLGAIFRSAAALGMDAVLLTPECADPLYRRCIRVSMGTVFQIPWARLDGTAEEWQRGGAERLRRMGFRTAAMALRPESLLPSDPRLRAEPRLAVVLGTEGDGLCGATIAGCDYTVCIPMAHGVDSLNVAAAAAVAFWALKAPD